MSKTMAASNGWSVVVFGYTSPAAFGWKIQALRPDGSVVHEQSRKSERGARKTANEWLQTIEDRGWF